LALLVGRKISRRFGASLRVIAAGAAATDGTVQVAGLQIERENRSVVPALRDASAAADLLIVGSRARRGAHALDSVSERIAHQARCSVLVVR